MLPQRAKWNAALRFALLLTGKTPERHGGVNTLMRYYEITEATSADEAQKAAEKRRKANQKLDDARRKKNDAARAYQDKMRRANDSQRDAQAALRKPQ